MILPKLYIFSEVYIAGIMNNIHNTVIK